MGIRHDVEEGLEKYEITKIEGQPTEEDLNQLTLQISNAVGSVATSLGGGEHGHVGIIIDQTEYITFSKGAATFDVPTNPGPYPKSPDADAVAREQQIAEHKALQDEYQTYLGVESFVRRKIVESIDDEWLAEIKSETMGFNHLHPKAIMKHLRDVGGTLDHMDVTELTTNLYKEWDGVETPAAHFARGDKYERQLLKAGQKKNPELRLAFAMTHFKADGDFEAALREWDALNKSAKTFSKFRVFIQKEFANRKKHNKTTAGSVGKGIANNVTDKQLDEVDRVEMQAMLMAEFANTINEQTQKQFKEMMDAFTKALGNKNSPNPPANPTGGKKKKKCPHCLKEVYHKPEKCFELEANADKRPAGWKSTKET